MRLKRESAPCFNRISPIKLSGLFCINKFAALKISFLFLKLQGEQFFPLLPEYDKKKLIFILRREPEIFQPI